MNYYTLMMFYLENTPCMNYYILMMFYPDNTPFTCTKFAGLSFKKMPKSGACFTFNYWVTFAV